MKLVRPVSRSASRPWFTFWLVRENTNSTITSTGRARMAISFDRIGRFWSISYPSS